MWRLVPNAFPSQLSSSVETHDCEAARIIEGTILEDTRSKTLYSSFPTMYTENKHRKVLKRIKLSFLKNPFPTPSRKVLQSEYGVREALSRKVICSAIDPYTSSPPAVLQVIEVAHPVDERVSVTSSY